MSNSFVYDFLNITKKNVTSYKEIIFIFATLLAKLIYRKEITHF